jgi:hypothetical protein
MGNSAKNFREAQGGESHEEETPARLAPTGPLGDQFCTLGGRF